MESWKLLSEFVVVVYVVVKLSGYEEGQPAWGGQGALLYNHRNHCLLTRVAVFRLGPNSNPKINEDSRLLHKQHQMFWTADPINLRKQQNKKSKKKGFSIFFVENCLLFYLEKAIELGKNARLRSNCWLIERLDYSRVKLGGQPLIKFLCQVSVWSSLKNKKSRYFFSSSRLPFFLGIWKIWYHTWVSTKFFGAIKTEKKT